MNQNDINNDFITTQNGNNGSIFLSIRLPLKYFQTPEQSFYRMEMNQYKISATSNNNKIYMMNMKDTKLAVVIYKL